MSSSDSQAVAAQIVAVSRRLHAQGYLAACDGNVSVRLSDNDIMITPGGRPKADLAPDEMARIDLHDNVHTGKPSSERLMHLEIYRRCPQAKSVIHAHTPVATAWTVARPELTELPYRQLAEVILAAGRIPIAPYARTGTADMGAVLQPYLPQHRLIVLPRHGSLSWGETLEEAHGGIERIEHVATTLMHAQAIAGPGRPLSELPDDEIEELLAKRASGPQRTL
jgi:L-fuculose-phosphate aldolase